MHDTVKGMNDTARGMNDTAGDDQSASGSVVSIGAAAFALLQSVCALFVALAGLQTLVGLGALSTAILQYAVPFHTDWVRIPMLILAIVGAVVVLWSVHRKRSLRARASAEWRRRPVSKEKLRQERFQIVLAMVTLSLTALEMILHYHFHHHV